MLGGGSTEKRWHAACGCCSCDQERSRNDRKCSRMGGADCACVMPHRDRAIERSSERRRRSSARVPVVRRGNAVNGDDAHEAVMMCARARVTRGARERVMFGVADRHPHCHHQRASERRRRRHARSMDPPSLPGNGAPSAVVAARPSSPAKSAGGATAMVVGATMWIFDPRFFGTFWFWQRTRSVHET